MLKQTADIVLDVNVLTYTFAGERQMKIVAVARRKCVVTFKTLDDLLVRFHGAGKLRPRSQAAEAGPRAPPVVVVVVIAVHTVKAILVINLNFKQSMNAEYSYF